KRCSISRPPRRWDSRYRRHCGCRPTRSLNSPCSRATSELLKVIGRSTFDLRPVFQTLAENAVRLCEAGNAAIYQFDGQVLRIAAAHNGSRDVSRLERELLQRYPIPLGRHSGAARAALERRTIHIHDIHSDPDYTWRTLQAPEQGPSVPPLR